MLWPKRLVMAADLLGVEVIVARSFPPSDHHVKQNN
jgi:hypothetical protein